MKLISRRFIIHGLVLLSFLGIGELLVMSEAGAQERVETIIKPDKPRKKKKKNKKNRKKRRGIASENSKRKRGRKAFVENHLQNERRRFHEKSAFDDLSHTLGGSLRLEGRHFPSPSPDGNAVGSNYSLVGEFEMALNYDSFEGKIWNMARVDFSDDERTRLLPYENWMAYKSDDFQLKAGTQIENWSMSEIFHPSDVLNSRNIDSEIESSEKIGEPMVSARVGLFGGFATLYYMPLFWTPILPSEKSRFSVLPPNTKLLDSAFLNDNSLNENDSFVNQWAFRYTRQIGDADIAFHYMSMIDRQQPLFAADALAGGVRPIFLPVDQVGVNGSIVGGGYIYKFDVVQRKFPETFVDPSMGLLYQPDHTIGALGIEHAISMPSGAEATLFAEWQKIFGVEGNEARRLSIFQNDLMIGANLAFNNLKNSEFRAFFILDMDDSSETLWSMNYSQKLSNNFKLGGGYRGISVLRGLSKPLNDSDHLFVNLTYFFER